MFLVLNLMVFSIVNFVSFSKKKKRNFIFVVMISIPASNAVDGGFQLQSVQTNDYDVGMCCFSAKRTDLRRKSKDW